MQIKTLQVNCYKSLSHLRLDNLTGVNVFIGQNNSGKSNILDAIESVFLPFDDNVNFFDNDADYAVEIQLDEKSKQFWQTRAEILIAKRLGSKKSYFLDKLEITDHKQVADFFYQRTVRFTGQLVNNLEKIREDYTDLKNNYAENFRKLWGMFHQYFPDIDEIISSEESSAITKEIKARLKEGGKVVEFSRLGSGVQRLLVSMLYLFHPRYSIVLMNEPEIHLHPALIRKLVNLLLADREIEQIFLTTHSVIFITPNNLKQVFRVSKNQGQLTEVYGFTTKDNIDQKRLVQEFNADNLEMFFADKVVIVEGVSDKILIRGLIDKFYDGTKEIKVIYVSGKSNIDIYMQLMAIFKIPYLVMLDRDALSSSVRIGALQRILPRNARSFQAQVDYLKQHHIYILPNGTIEKNYPRRYQRKDTKPLNALYAADQIQSADFYSPAMKYLREVIEIL